MSTFPMVTMMSIITLSIIAACIAIGCIVYKDAKSYGLNQWMWALIAVFAPNFIGIIIYLVIRSNKQKQVYCSKCKVKVESNFNICPSCKSVFENSCGVCKHVLPKEVNICPYCGEGVHESKSVIGATKESIKTNIGKSLAITLGMLFITLIVIFISLFLIQVNSGSMPNTHISLMSTENNWGNKLTSTFGYKQGTQNKTITISENEHLYCSFGVDKGWIRVIVQDEEGVELLNEKIENNTKQFDILPDNEKTQKVKIKLIFEKAKGSYEINTIPNK